VVSEGDEIRVGDFGSCKLNENGQYTIYLVEEEDGSINWYLHPSEHSDVVLTSRKVDLIKEG